MESEDITALYEELKELNARLAVRTFGRVAITTSCFERVNEFLEAREARRQFRFTVLRKGSFSQWTSLFDQEKPVFMLTGFA